MCRFVPYGFGWHRDLSDVRDFTPQEKKITRLLKGLKPCGPGVDRVDWREYFGTVQDQQSLATSVPYACVALARYFERRASGRILEPSAMFVYQVAKRLLGWTGDSGIPLRTALQVMACFGVPPESCWPHDPERFDCQPDAFIFALAQRFGTLYYVRLDGGEARGSQVLQTVRSWLAAGFPSVFGFPVTSSLSAEAEIPYPTAFDSIRGGQAVVAVGYDDQRRLSVGKGALLVRSSWGTRWGESGYGWLPYAYVRERLAADFWTFFSPEWLASGEFRRP
jgi:C1A family cysteine protease